MRAPRAHACTRKIVAVTGSVGKTGTKEALRLALSADGETHASAASYNNHWGVPLSLARCPADAKYAVFEIGMNHAGEITPLTQTGAPACGDRHRVSSRCIWNISARWKRSPMPRRKSFLASSRAAPPCSIATTRNIARLAAAAKAARIARHRLLRRTRRRRCTAAVAFRCMPNVRPLRRDILGQPVTYKLGAPGRHLVLNSLAVLAAVSLVGADLALAALALDNLKPASRPWHAHRTDSSWRQRVAD